MDFLKFNLAKFFKPNDHLKYLINFIPVEVYPLDIQRPMKHSILVNKRHAVCYIIQ